MNNITEFKKPDPYWKVQKIKLYADIGTFTSVVQFAEGSCHIVVDKGCWCLVNSGRFSRMLTPRALSIIKQLPDNPYDYLPYMRTLNLPKD